jgi:hypothetical protein
MSEVALYTPTEGVSEQDLLQKVARTLHLRDFV